MFLGTEFNKAFVNEIIQLVLQLPQCKINVFLYLQVYDYYSS